MVCRGHLGTLPFIKCVRSTTVRLLYLFAVWSGPRPGISPVLRASHWTAKTKAMAKRNVLTTDIL